ncbi:MAG: hypothetical protein EBY16_08370 [Gammaproteobacteria bacterium]|nr:hypothetical protein [Gammaproteobacteria bacterium]
MRNLEAYINKQNVWNAIFNKRQMDVNNLTSRDIAELQDSLEAELSPENLCCDGELSGKALIQKSRWLQGALADLQKISA